MNLSDTIASLAARRKSAVAAQPSGDRLKDFADFGQNPGNLTARIHVPNTVSAGCALVVVLHGCTQTAAGYDIGAGWSKLADEQGFILLFPEQRRANNPNLCFNWFVPEDTRRGGGEVLSIHQMIEAMLEHHPIDPARVFITGLSAGGAMTSAMLATYPETFAGGAIIAGLPYGGATNVSEALERMRGRGGPGAAALGKLVRAASTHRGRWPTVSVWHGSSDATVDVANADAIVAQWRAVHQVAEHPTITDLVDGHQRRAWRDATGRVVIDEYRIAGMGHGTPLDMSEADRCGVAGAYMLDAGISSTRHIAKSWGLPGSREAAPRPKTRGGAAPAEPAPEAALGEKAGRLPMLRSVRPTRMPDQPPPEPTKPTDKVTRIIEDALRAAGLMR